MSVPKYAIVAGIAAVAIVAIVLTVVIPQAQAQGKKEMANQMIANVCAHLKQSLANGDWQNLTYPTDAVAQCKQDGLWN